MYKKQLYLDVEENPKKISHWILFSLQHILAALVATITVPLLTGLPIAPTLISAGIGTMFYILMTKFKSPVFLSSSFAYLNPMFSALAVGEIGKAGGMNYAAIILGMIMVGLAYTIIAVIIKFTGTKWINSLLSPIIVGPVIMVIGLGLAGSAISNLTNTNVSEENYNLVHIFCGLVAMVITAVSAHYGEGKIIGLIPFVIGMTGGYILAALFTLTVGRNNPYFSIINFEPLTKIFGDNFSISSIFNYKLFIPNSEESFIFLKFDELKQWDWADIGTVILLFVPVSFVTVCEHIGDHENLGNIIGRDLLNGEPGMTRTLIGDGVATAISGVLCGTANTTYGENVAVIGTTKIASVRVVWTAAIATIVLGFITPFSAILETIPGCICGGVSLVLYGFIASSGVKMLIQEKVDFNKTKNIFIAAVILVSGIGGLTIQFDKIKITSIAVSMVMGIILNVILKDRKETVKDYEIENVDVIEKNKISY